MLFVTWHLTILPAADLLSLSSLRTDPSSSTPSTISPSRNHWKETCGGLACDWHRNWVLSPSLTMTGDFFNVTDGANSTNSLMEVDWGTLSAEFWASHVIVVLWWYFFIGSFSMDRVFLRFPSGNVSVIVSIWSFIGEFQLSSQVIWKWIETDHLMIRN